MQNRSSSQYPRKSTACPNCRRLLNDPKGKCIYCGYPFPKITASLPLMGELLREEVTFVNGIIITCAVLYVLALFLDFPAALQGGGIFNMLSPSSQSLLKLGMGGFIPLLRGEWWTLLTATYLHASILHILFNMLWLRQLGPFVESLFGPSRFIIIYTVSGVTGALVSALIGRTPFFVGASGAVFGLFGALIYYGIRRGGTFGTAIFRQMLFWAAIGLFLGFTRSGVDNLGHIGGIVGGVLAAWVLGFQERHPQRLTHHLGALATLAFIILCFGMMVFNFFS